MTAVVLDGRAVARRLTEELRERVSALPFTPRLVFVRAGEDPASASYVRSKARLAERAGVESETIALGAETGQGELERLIETLNADEGVDGILVQLPLYRHLDPRRLLTLIDPAKDVDGFHPINVGRLWNGEEGLFPATPMGLMRILEDYEVPVSGRRVLIIGRSNLVGRPAAALFLRSDATVTIAHSRTRNLEALCREAEILVAATGRPWMVSADMVSPGAVVLDVGQSPVEGVLRGDVHPDVMTVAGAMTPTPGGTGPMTVAMVIANTVAAATRRRAAGA